MASELDVAILVIDSLVELISFDEAVTRLSNGIAARAQAEGRDVTDAELALCRGLADEGERRRRGGAPVPAV